MPSKCVPVRQYVQRHALCMCILSQHALFMSCFVLDVAQLRRTSTLTRQLSSSKRLEHSSRNHRLKFGVYCISLGFICFSAETLHAFRNASCGKTFKSAVGSAFVPELFVLLICKGNPETMQRRDYNVTPAFILLSHIILQSTSDSS